MHFNKFGKTGWEISAISFGCWAIGDTWGKVDDKESMAALHRAIEHGVNLFDTADVYGDGHSERLLGQLKKEHSGRIYIATKAGRRLNPHIAAGYNKENINAFVECSLKNLGTEALDLLQLHCPPTEVYYMPEVFAILDDLVKEGKILFYGVSVEKVEEALKAIEYEHVQSVQIIYNMFRQRPAEIFFEQALKRSVAIIARVPLASGLLTGKFKKDSVFEDNDHRSFNRNGEMFDRGETFSGVDYLSAIEAVETLKTLCPPGMTLAQFALRWILMHDAVTCAIPGAKRAAQVDDNINTIKFPELSEKAVHNIKNIYNNHIKHQVHQYW